jgi:DNA invertase Pin-like site-specific DNA recombinase
MKKAIGYVRISTEDQSNFSIDGQEKQIIDYCIKNKIELINVFKDEGQSAKNFDRLDWINLEKFIKKNHTDVDVLIVPKYDRFSRNLSEALQMISKLEKKFSITIISVMEHIGLHPKSPYFFQFRTQMLLGAEVEWLVIRDRTKFGNHSAHKNGRWINKAPKGYINARDEKNKPIIIVDEKKAPLIQEIFNLYLAHTSIEQIRKTLKSKGLTITGNSSIQWILSNPLYAGLIKVEAYYDEPEQLVKGIHQPIISEEVWWKAQALLNGAKNRNHSFINDHVPLRGALRCHCHKLLTAGNSKSKSGKYIWYYNCGVHRKPNLRADMMHEKFNGILQELNFTEQQIDIIVSKTKKKLDESIKDKTKSLAIAKLELKQVENKIESLEEKYILNAIDKETYFKWKPRFVEDKSEAIIKIEQLSSPIEKIISNVNDSLSKLSNLSYLYNSNSTQGKQAFVNLVFDNNLYYENDIYRTPDILPLFYSKSLILKQKNLLIIEKVFSKSIAFLEKCPQQELYRTLNPILNLINNFKVA